MPSNRLHSVPETPRRRFSAKGVSRRSIAGPSPYPIAILGSTTTGQPFRNVGNSTFDAKHFFSKRQLRRGDPSRKAPGAANEEKRKHKKRAEGGLWISRSEHAMRELHYSQYSGRSVKYICEFIRRFPNRFAAPQVTSNPRRSEREGNKYRRRCNIKTRVAGMNDHRPHFTKSAN